MNKIILAVILFATSIAQADTLTLTPSPTLTSTVDTSQQKKEIHNKCIDGLLYRKVYSLNGTYDWYLVYINNQPETCSGNYQE